MSATGKNERIAQILETDVTREQLAEVVWSMERDHANHVDLIKELMSRRAALRSENAELQSLVRNMYTCMEHVEGFGVYYDCENCVLNTTRACDFEERMLALGIEVEE